MRSALVCVLLVACSSLPDPHTREQVRALDAASVQMRQPRAQRSECSGVAVAPRRVLTAHHCARGRLTWHVLTRHAWAHYGELVPVTRGRCWTHRCPDDVADCVDDIDGVCEYLSESDLPAHLPATGWCSDGDPAAIVHSATHSEFRSLVTYVDQSERRWIYGRGAVGSGASGAPVMCGLVGAIVTHGNSAGWVAFRIPDEAR